MQDKDDIIDSGGFRVLLEQALRVEDEGGADWSAHSVHYDEFKQRLRVLAQRRTKIRRLAEESPDGKIAEEAWAEIVGPESLERTSSAARSGYVAMDDESTEAESRLSRNSQRKKWKRRTKRQMMRRISNSERNEITMFLAYEMDKAMMFYASQWQKLSNLIEQRPSGNDVADIGSEILELFAFCVIQIVATHQMLIRYDAFARAFEGTPMKSYYLMQATREATSFRKILHHEELRAIADTFVQDQESTPYIAEFRKQQNMFEQILARLDESPTAQNSELARSVSWTGNNWKKSLKGLGRWMFIVLFKGTLGLEPSYLTGRGKSLTNEMEQLALWRREKKAIRRPAETEKRLTALQKFHLTLNLLSAFFYCMNYYIVEPSSTLYCNRLGAHDTMSGTLIGMVPLAAFVSSIPYSMWTNHSFRQPFIMSCCMLVLGNFVYSAADIFGDFRIALMGRFICGLGAPKCIIRRFMADTTPMSLRTGVNAGFGMVVAAGSAMGPAMAVILSSYEYTLVIPNFAYVTINGLTLPGYFMAFIWLAFTVVVLATFEEPEREGLWEQKEMELSTRTAKSSVKQKLIDGVPQDMRQHINKNDTDLITIFSGASKEYSDAIYEQEPVATTWYQSVRNFLEHITLPVRICLGLLFAKVFTVETLVSATSSLAKNRYRWVVQQVGLLGFSNGVLVIPFSIFIGRLSLLYPDRLLMRWLVIGGCVGFFLLIDMSDLFQAPTADYNKGHILAVTPARYILGYFTTYLSVQVFEGVIGSTLSKLIPTALASGTFNSGLLATLVDTLGRTCGDLFITLAGFVDLRQLMNLLFIPGFLIMLTCLVVIEKFQDVLSV